MASLKPLLRFGLHRLGGLRALHYCQRRRFTVLMYHRFPAEIPGVQDIFHRQCAYLKRHFQVVPLAQIADALQTRRSLPPGAAAITVDDGYGDFFVNAAPVLKAHGLSATVFLISGFLDRQLWLWWDQVAWAFRRTRRPAVAVPFDALDEPARFTLGTEAEREAARAAFEARLIPMQHARRLELLAALPQLLELEIPTAAPSGYEPLTWDQVRRLARQGIEFGAHTKTHPILSTLHDPAVLKEEIEGSKRRIETELGQPVVHFCYPNGRWSDFNQQTVEVVESCGFRTACTAEHGQNRLTANRYLLLRVGAGPDLPDHYFKERLAAIH